MLIVHPASTCDVCLDPYSWASTNSTPHAIACGHVFCLGCLQSTTPPNCPLCRKVYLPGRAKKLHVDRPTPDLEGDDDLVQIISFLHRLSLCSGDDASRDRAERVVTEVESWLSTRTQNEGPYRTLRTTVAAVNRYRRIQQDSAKLQDTIDKQEQEYQEHILILQEELRAKSVAEHRLKKVTQSLEEELSDATKVHDDLRIELQRVQASHSRLQNELAERQSKGNRLPTPPRPSSYDDFATSALPATVTRRSTLSNTTNIVNHDASRTAAFYPYAGPPQPAEVPPPQPVIQPVPERNQLHPPPSFRYPIMVPGAPASERIIPPSPRQRESFNIYAVPALVPGPSSHSYNYTPLSYDHTTPRPPDNRSAVAGRSPHYAFAPGAGYVQNHLPYNVSTTSVPNMLGGQLTLHTPQPQSQGSSRIEPRTVEQAPRVLPAPEEMQPEQATSRTSNRNVVRSRRSSSSSAVPQARRVDPGTSATHSSSSFINPALQPPLAAPVRATAPAALVAPRGDASSEPSIASTWGTLPSARASRSSGLSDLNLIGLPTNIPVESALSSQFPSLEELNIANLPDFHFTTLSPGSQEEIPSPTTYPGLLPGAVPDRILAAPVTNTQPAGAPHATDGLNLTPNTAHMIDGQNAVANQEQEAGPSASGLGLMDTPSSSRAQVAGQGDLREVDRALLQHAAESRRRSHHSSSFHTRSRAHSRSRSRADARPRDIDSANSAGDKAFAPTLSLHGPSNGSSTPSPADRNTGPYAMPGPMEMTESNSDRARRRHSVSRTIAGVASSLMPGSRRSGERGRTVGWADAANSDEDRRRYTVHTDATSPTHTRPRSRSRDPSHNSAALEVGFGSSSSSSLHNGSSLLLSFEPLGPGASAATTSTGEPTSIHAPRPRPSTRGGSLFRMLNPNHR